MPLITANRLCPHATFIEGNFTKYRRASEKFIGILADFSPCLEPMGLDEAYLDVTSFESMHTSIRQMALSIKQRIKSELALCASIGVAGCKIVAKVASDLSKPDGLIEINSGGDQSFLAPLPVAKLPGIGTKTEEVLKSLGITTIGRLSNTQLSILKGRFGASGEMLHRFSNGKDDSKVKPTGEAKSISRETTFGQDIGNHQQLEAALHFISERVGNALRLRGRQARSIILKLRYSDFTTITRRHTLNRASNTDQVIFDTGRQLLRKVFSINNLPIRLIGIGVANLTEPGSQLNMLDSSTRKQGRLNQAIDQIRRKYGFSSIQTGRTMLLKDIPGITLRE
jgi:DNA polymerase-4